MRKPKPHPIRAARQSLGLTQGDVAKAIGVTTPTISRWESGIDLPDPPNAKRLVDQLPGLTLDLIYAKAA